MVAQRKYNPKKKSRTVYKILFFVFLLFVSISPLFLLNHKVLQFFGAAIILVIGLYLNSKYLDKREFSEYGLIFSKQTFIHLFVGFIIGVFAVLFMLFIGNLSDIILISGHTKSIQISALLYFLIKVLLIAIIEEIFFRGYLFTVLKDVFKTRKGPKKKRIWMALVISSLLFGLAHFNTNDFSIFSSIFLALNGIVWCVPFVLTKNLGLSIGMHTTWNFTQTQLGFTMSGNKAKNAFYLIKNQGSNFITGGEYGPEAGLLGALGFAMMLILSLIYIKFSTDYNSFKF